MSYAVGAALQSAIYTRISSDDVVASLVGTAVYDAIPPGPLPSLYVTLGEEDAKDASDKDAAGTQHDVSVSVVTDAAGFQAAKEVATAVSDALLGGGLGLSRGRLVGLWFRSAKARQKGAQRRIDLTFRARVEDI